MKKNLSLTELVKKYLAQPLQSEFGYKDIPDVTSTTKKEEEEEKIKKPVIYVPPSGDGGGGGGIGSLGDGTFIGGGKSLEDAGGTYPGGYQSAEGGFEFTGDGRNLGGGEITADGPGYGTMGDGRNLGGGEITADGPGYGTMGTGIGGMGLGEFTADGPGFGTMGTGIGGGEVTADGPGFGTMGTGIGGQDADANDGFGNDGFDDYSDFDDGTMTGSAGQDGNYGLGPSGLSAPSAPSNPNAREGADEGGGRNKIVCTMMNESYGFGSFRNKIWMKFHKDLSPEYQKGYHKLFLPLVKISKTNKVIKKILEHIAVHSTIDMRQATRGKIYLLGRIYRKILLPICYFVGKHG